MTILLQWMIPALGWLLAIALWIVVWSNRTQRPSRVRANTVPPFPEILPALQGLSQGWRVPGNRVEILQNGDGFFPRLLADIEHAKRSIHIESYVWWQGDICERIAAALSRRARSGLRVRLVLDALGSLSMSDQLRAQMIDAGCRIALFHDFRFRTVGRLNKRTHRKLAVIDGRIGYVFSHGFAAEWEGAGDRRDAWRDTGVRLEGPIVGHIQSAFAEHWMEETSEVLADTDDFPELPPAGDVVAHLVTSSPRGGVSNVSILLRVAIAAARSELVISTPYFAPRREVAEMLVGAARRGVRVRILLPGPVTDSKLTHYAGRYLFERLLHAGIEIHEHQVTLPHQKVMVVDRVWSCLGSANMDERSFDINAEIAIGLLGERVAEELCAAFDEDLLSCRHIDRERWLRRSRWERLKEWATYQIHEQL